MPARSIPRDAAYQIINDELMLDGAPRLNLASFVTTWMEPECGKLIMASLNKNYVDMNEYPVTTELQNRCVNMIAHLFHAPIGDEEAAVDEEESHMTSPTLSLALMCKFAGKNLQVTLRLSSRSHSGSTLTGEFEDVKLLNELLTKKNKETWWDIPIHVDAASGGFIAPFLYPNLEWDFCVPIVKSINVSGPKYGPVYPGVGWVVWRTKDDLPDDLVFHINYLGSDQPTFTFNFSRGIIYMTSGELEYAS
ncbi:hypothetical protein L6164_006333 [Bauhinia variegata]|uniref:Uncharacterized protein n=1 Tax=Bauhinia variegata TaxID=167791 RepID=A0ACB9PTI6_BAUVA|nr:hypothetical protein L6164_006333 [Bauhinia variegata]